MTNRRSEKRVFFSVRLPKRAMANARPQNGSMAEGRPQKRAEVNRSQLYFRRRTMWMQTAYSGRARPSPVGVTAAGRPCQSDSRREVRPAGSDSADSGPPAADRSVTTTLMTIDGRGAECWQGSAQAVE